MQSVELVSLSGAVAVVTGGGRGIGQSISTKLAAMGATVVLTLRRAGARRRALAATSLTWQVLTPLVSVFAPPMAGWMSW
jgi:NAD(P)-dependent dehydrogenase (short-subunit alcohol dehydrogenase family)